MAKILTILTVSILGVVGLLSCRTNEVIPHEGAAAPHVAEVEGQNESSSNADVGAILEQPLTVTGPDGRPSPVLTIFPKTARSKTNVQVVIALHGRGESGRGPEAGHRGWMDDYSLGEAFQAVLSRKLSRQDYRGFIDEERLQTVNALLSERPVQPLVVVTPYLPDLMRERPGSEGLRRYGEWLAGPLLDKVREALPFVSRDRERTGVDGVSLGGMVALETGFNHSNVFGVVGAIQPAITGRVTYLVQAATRDEQRQHIRLLTSRGDVFLQVTQQLSQELRQAGIVNEAIVVPGPHDYSFNRGPGSIELLLFHGEPRPTSHVDSVSTDNAVSDASLDDGAAKTESNVVTKLLSKRKADDGLPRTPQLLSIEAADDRITVRWWIRYTWKLRPRPEADIKGSKINIAVKYSGSACPCAEWYKHVYETAVEKLPPGEYTAGSRAFECTVSLPTGRIEGCPLRNKMRTKKVRTRSEDVPQKRPSVVDPVFAPEFIE